MNSIVGDRYIAELVQIFEQQGMVLDICADDVCTLCVSRVCCLA